MMKKILITGGTGYLGRNLALFYKKKYKVFIGARNNKQNFLVKNLTNCEVVPLDVSNIESVNDCLNYSKPDIVIHAAATKFVDLSEKFPFECIDINIVGSANIARACINKKVPTVIGVSTDKASPPIKNIYGLSKSCMERLFSSIEPYGKTKFICVRYGNVTWSTGSVLPIWKQMFNKNKTILTTGPNMRRFFFSVDEAVSLIDQALKLKDKLAGKILSAEMKSSKMIDILKVWIKKFGGNYKIIQIRKGDRLDEYLIGEDELKYAEVLKIKGKKYFVINFNKLSKKPLKKIVSSKDAKKLSQSEIEKIIQFGLRSNEL
ncbi:polysaccharide biosynthesis protein [Pelagibacterales bacterium SAG-MED12]|nr:polysaccharide biosynthesis protein [Pelagibacterales bacterium SAG-MED12]